MAKLQLSVRSKDSTLQDMLPYLSNEAIEEMYHSKIKLASDKCMKSTRQTKDLEKDINILATELKVRNVNIYARTSSRKSKVEPIAERHKATFTVEKGKKQRATVAAAKKVEVSSGPTRKQPKYNSASSLEDVASNIYSNARSPTYKNVESNPLEDDKKKVSFDELIHLKGSRNSWPQQIEKNSGLEQQLNNHFILKGKELDFEQVDYQMIKDKEDAIVQEHLDMSRLKKEHDAYCKPKEQTGCDVEEENLYTLVVALAEPLKFVESLYRPPSVDRSLPSVADNSNLISLAGSSRTDEKAEKSAMNDKHKRSEGLVYERVVERENVASTSSEPKED